MSGDFTIKDLKEESASTGNGEMDPERVEEQ